jgi:hypothetical protein
LLLPEHLLAILWFLASKIQPMGRFLNTGIVKEIGQDIFEGNDHLNTLNLGEKQVKSHPSDLRFGFVALVCFKAFNLRSRTVLREPRCR